jgi:hypothetical protein
MQIPAIRKLLAGAILVFGLTAVLPAQADITGKWQGATRAGTPVVLNLKSSRGVLTGTVTRGDQTSEITEGKLVKATFTFKTMLGEQTEALTGEVDGAQLKIWLDRQGREGTVVFDRVKE